jgi:hypothetical protein
MSVSSTVDEEKDDERRTRLIKGTGTPAEEKEEDREQEKDRLEEQNKKRDIKPRREPPS